MKQVRVLISGRVQGVGYRFWTEDEAARRRLDGWVRNRIDGRVEAVFAGDPAQVEDMVRACREGPRSARVTAVETLEHDGAVEPGFRSRPTA
ncbi:MAG: acylphosphatase [Kiloniellales bacterium]